MHDTHAAPAPLLTSAGQVLEQLAAMRSELGVQRAEIAALRRSNEELVGTLRGLLERFGPLLAEGERRLAKKQRAVNWLGGPNAQSKDRR